jgi:shikimate dehydrogenase
MQRKRAIVVGCGGVGAAIAFALAEAGVASIAVCDIDAARADALAARLVAQRYDAYVSRPVAAGFEVIVNATPMGMHESDPLPLDCAGLSPSAIVCDAVMHPPDTRLLKIAASAGCFTQPGTFLLDHQLQLMADFFGFDMRIELPQALRLQR